MTLTRWPGKPTSGRYVYACTGGWFWQCDLHRGEGDEDGSYAVAVLPSMQAAFAEALAHAARCAESNERSPDDRRTAARDLRDIGREIEGATDG